MTVPKYIDLLTLYTAMQIVISLGFATTIHSYAFFISKLGVLGRHMIGQRHNETKKVDEVKLLQQTN